MRRVAAVVMSCLLGAAPLTGCGRAETKPAPHEAPSASPSPTVSPAPTMPAAAKEAGAKGAEAFVRHYVELINHAQATGDVSNLQENSRPTCQSCSDSTEVVENIYSQGGHIEGGAWRIASILAVLPRKDIGGWIVDINVSFGPQTIVTNGSSKALKGGSSPFSFSVAQVSGGWEMAEWSRGR